MAERFDVVVLGGGPGGYAAALYGAAAGLRIAMVEETRVGGTCLHRGCIPAKELLQTAEVLRTVRTAKEFGVDAGQPTLDLSTSQARKQQVVDRLTKGLESLLKGRKVTVVPGTGTIIDAAAHHIRVSDGSELMGDALILATGSLPRELPGLPFDGTQVLSSDHFLVLDEVPARTAIIGGGAIGCEFASFLADVGSDVTLLEAMPAILPGVDKQAADQVVARVQEARHQGRHRRRDRRARPCARAHAALSRRRPVRVGRGRQGRGERRSASPFRGHRSRDLRGRRRRPRLHRGRRPPADVGARRVRGG